MVEGEGVVPMPLVGSGQSPARVFEMGVGLVENEFRLFTPEIYCSS